MNKTSKRAKVVFLGTVLSFSVGCILACIFDIIMLPLCLCIGSRLGRVCAGILYPNN